MSLESRMKFPAPEIPIDTLIAKIERYKAQGLTDKEAGDLLSLEEIEEKAGTLFPEENKRKKTYLKKLTNFQNQEK